MGEVDEEQFVRVRRLRREKGLSQTQLAALVGTGPSAISEIEHGKRNPTLTTLRKIAKALNVKTRDLIGDD